MNSENETGNSSDPTGQDYLPYWYFAGGSVVLYVVYLIHLYLNRVFTQYLVSLSIYVLKIIHCIYKIFHVFNLCWERLLTKIFMTTKIFPSTVEGKLPFLDVHLHRQSNGSIFTSITGRRHTWISTWDTIHIIQLPTK